MRTVIALVVLMLVSGCVTSKPSVKSHPTARENIDRLRKLDAAISEERAEPMPDEAIHTAFAYLADDIPDDQLDDIAGYALSTGTRNIRWQIADLCVDRGRFDAAVRIYVAALHDRPSPRDYGMWKRWEYIFGRRDDYEKLGRELTQELFRYYAKAPKADRVIIAELFALPPTAADLSPPRFRDVVEQRDHQ